MECHEYTNVPAARMLQPMGPPCREPWHNRIDLEITPSYQVSPCYVVSIKRAVLGVQKALLLLLAATPAVAGVGAISVEVVDAVTRRPVDGVTITAESRDGEVRSATT